ncbi:MAG: HDOD domain-containing protein [Syntrophales bacterium]|nr:HDOD domain-containing protein [Syntrophales bacterium]
MGILSIKTLEPNMVLADDLKDSSGRLLIAKGTTLTEKYLKICKMWGVVEADIEGITSDECTVEGETDFNPEDLAMASEFVHKRFCRTDMYHPAIRELINLCVIRKAKGKKIDQDNFKEVSWSPEQIKDMERRKPFIINMKKLINEDTKLSTLPVIYRQILEAISKPSSSSYDIENVISKDTNLSARLLRIVNSAFYGYPYKIDTISRAVNVIGTKQLSTLAIGVNIISIFKDIPPEIINMKMFWKHSVLCGICARIIASYMNIQNTERMFVAGLLHDIGRLVLYNNMSQESLYTVMIAGEKGQSLHQAESDLFSLDHAVIGGELLTKWQMPMSLEDTVYNHHNPLRGKNRKESSILNLADIIANAIGIGTSGERLIPPLHQEVWMQLGLSPNILPLIVEQADKQLEEIFELIHNDDRKLQKK